MRLARNSLAVLATLIACASWAGAAQAVTYTVNNPGDQSDENPGDQVCRSDTQGCTLRAAVEEAGADDNFLDNTVIVPAGTYEVSRPLTPGFTTHIVGASARTTVIRRDPDAGTTRVFDISFATVDIRRVTISGGSADFSNGFAGGNLRVQNRSDVTLSETTITGGDAESGGGISNVGATTRLINSTVAGNAAVRGGGDGGAVQNGDTVAGQGPPSHLVVRNSTISGNEANIGGGIFSETNAGNSVVVEDSTIANNSARNRLDKPNGGGLSILDGSATVVRSIVAHNTSPEPTTPNCATDPFAGPPASISSLGRNLESGGDCGFKAGGDIQSSDPRLGPLANNGGQTDTRALVGGSPAVDAAGTSCAPTDQRGVVRPQGPACDIGAFEVGVPPPDTVIVAGPTAVTRDRTPTFSFSSPQAGTTFECSLDGAPFAPCTSPFTPPAALAAGTHTFRVRARDAAGNVDPTPATFTFVIPAQLRDLPPPVIGKTFNAEPISGEVTGALPAGASAARGARAAQKGRTFIPLREARQLPVGTHFNTEKGRVRLQTATARRGRTQTGDFSSGLFQTLQSSRRSAKGLTELRLKGSSFRSCGRAGHGRRASAARHSKRRVRRLRGNANGRFRTRGRYSAATVRGTVWEVSDRCDGTLTKVTRGRVAVRDFRRRKDVSVKAGKSYLARARR